jgi:predicted DNA-binding transcriptional regulator AlpA
MPMTETEHDLMGAAEIAELFGVSRQRVQQLIGKADFPEPIAALAMGKVWASDAVRGWGVAVGRLQAGDEA